MKISSRGCAFTATYSPLLVRGLNYASTDSTLSLAPPPSAAAAPHFPISHDIVPSCAIGDYCFPSYYSTGREIIRPKGTPF